MIYQCPTTGFLYDKRHELQLLVNQFMVQIISKLDHYYLALCQLNNEIFSTVTWIAG